MKTESIKFKNGDATLSAKVFLPQDLNNSKGFILFTHGLGYCAKSYNLSGKFFADKGYIFCTYSMRGHVGSTGEFMAIKAAEDIPFIIDRLIERYGREGNDFIAIMAHSTGALISLLASIRDKRIKCGSIISIVSSMSESFRHWFDSGYIEYVRKNYTHDGKIDPGIEKFLSSRDALELFRKGVPSKKDLSFKEKYGLLRLPSVYNFFYEIVHSPDIFDYADSIKIPLLFFKGKKDEVIPIKKTEELYRRMDGKARLVETDSQSHFFNNYWDIVQRDSLGFFETCRSIKNKQE